MPDLSIIIVSWNVRDLLRNCLHSVLAQAGGLALEIIVVDSGSADGTAEMVRQEFPTVHLIARADNVGFPKGNNLGLAVASGRAILLLNPDTVVLGDALPQSVAYLESHPAVGMVGCQLLNSDGSVQSSRRRFPTWWTAVFESTWLQPLAPRALLRHYYAEDVADGQTAEVDWVMGAFLLTRPAVVAQVGGMDEAYFMYSEELDWCKRIKLAGWRVVYLPTAQVIHHQGKSSEQAATQRHINFNRAKLRYVRLYHGRAAALALRLILLLNFAVQLLLEATKGIVGHKRALRWQRTHAYWQVLRSGLRPAGE